MSDSADNQGAPIKRGRGKPPGPNRHKKKLAIGWVKLQNWQWKIQIWQWRDWVFFCRAEAGAKLSDPHLAGAQRFATDGTIVGQKYLKWHPNMRAAKRAVRECVREMIREENRPRRRSLRRTPRSNQC